MSDIITFCTKILTVEIAPFLFVSSAIPCEFAMVPYVYILLSPQEEEVHWSLRGQYRHLAAHSSKRLTPLSAIILYLGNESKKYYCDIIALSLVLQV